MIVEPIFVDCYVNDYWLCTSSLYRFLFVILNIPEWFGFCAGPATLLDHGVTKVVSMPLSSPYSQTMSNVYPHLYHFSHLCYVSGIPVYKTKLVLFPIYWTLLLSFNLSEIWAYFEYFRITYMYRSNNFTIYVMMMTWLARDMCVLSTIYFSYHGSFVPRINYIIRDAFVLIKAIYWPQRNTNDFLFKY